MIFIDDENFINTVKSLQSSTLFDGDEKYIILFDKLNRQNQQLLAKTQLPKNRITIITENSKKVPSKYKHQVKTEKLYKKPDLLQAMKSVFNGSPDIGKLEQFDNRYIFTLLTRTAAYYPELAEKMSVLERYVYSPTFKYLVVNNLSGMRCIPRWR